MPFLIIQNYRALGPTIHLVVFAAFKSNDGEALRSVCNALESNEDGESVCKGPESVCLDLGSGSKDLEFVGKSGLVGFRFWLLLGRKFFDVWSGFWIFVPELLIIGSELSDLGISFKED